MHFSLAAIPALAGLVAALPQPQNLDFGAIAAAPAPTVTGPAINVVNQTNVYNGAVIASSAAAAISTSSLNEKRSPTATTTTTTSVDVNAACATQPDGYGPLAIPNTVSGFQNYLIFDAVADLALAPNGYTRIFTNYNGSMTGAGYLGLYTLESYDVPYCASLCNSVTDCLSFNLFYERDPQYNPAATCLNPPAFTNIKCTLWGLPSSKASATNYGQYREQFEVVIAGSNGYNLASPTPATVSNFNAADILAGAINNAAAFIGAEYYNSVFDPNVCAAVCQATTAANKAAAVASGATAYTPCNYFNAFVLSQNGAATGLYCSFYDAAVGKSYGTNMGMSSGGVAFSFGNSLGYALSVQDAGAC